MWDLEGKRVTGLYVGEALVEGTVESSRVKYGGVVQHTVKLDQPVEIFGVVRERVLLDEGDIRKVHQ
jgi:hypothetical protein